MDDEARTNTSRFVEFLEGVGAPLTLQIQPELLDTLAESPEALDAQMLEWMCGLIKFRCVNQT